ncbi:MAG: PRTRC system ThiF family protein [Reichenbachiella sp.]|uniref:PRTRC system ThiF family protein n=1 Tax=Reichenbachiella sp. TaxID=2184521 RepID=UPI0032644B15
MKPLMHYTPEYFREAVHPITIALAGCGGTGSNMLTQLAKIHVSMVAMGLPGLMVYAYDDDVVSEANRGRQLFGTGDIGRNKSIVLIERINRFFSLDWEAFPVKFGLYDKQPASNITISCVDTVRSREMIQETLKQQNADKSDWREDYSTPYYWMDLGNAKKTGQIILGTVPDAIKQPRMRKTKAIKKLLTVFEMFPDLKKYENKRDQGPSCSMAEALGKQDLFINSIMAQYAGQMLWDFLKDDQIGYQGLFINLENHLNSPIPLSA